MSQTDSQDHQLAQSLAALLELARRARHARSEAELGFLLVNDSMLLCPYRQAVLWVQGRGVDKLSGLVEPESNAPYTQWAAQVCAALAAPTEEGIAGSPRAFTASNLPEPLGRDWADWWPAHGAWIPVAGTGGLLLVREDPWDPTDLQVLEEWCATWAHALHTLRLRRRRAWWPWRRETDGVHPGRAPGWWRNKWLWALALMLAAGALPVPLSVLAPGELVPAHPLVVRAPVDGVIDVFHVQPNQSVRKGQPLFGFDEALIQSKLEVAQQALATASTELRQTTQQALVDARFRSQLAVLGGRIQERRAETSYLREQLARSRVLAPMDGVVLFDDPTEWIGKPVSIGERILRIASTDDAEVEAWVPLADAIHLPPGAEVTLYLNAAPLQPVSAKVRYMAHDATLRPDGSYAYRVRAQLDAAATSRVGSKGTARLFGPSVPLAYWVMRRPIAMLRTTLGI